MLSEMWRGGGGRKGEGEKLGGERIVGLEEEPSQLHPHLHRSVIKLAMLVAT